MLASSLFGLIYLIAFLAPGFVVILQVRRRLPLFAVGQSQFQFVLWVCLNSLVSHFVLLTLAFLISSIFTVLSEQLSFSLLFAKTLGEILPKNVQSIKVSHVLISILYVLAAFVAAIVVGPYLARLFASKKFGNIDSQSTWLNAFSEKHENFVLSILDNGYIVTGLAESISADVNALVSGNRDIVLIDARVFLPNGVM